MPPLGPKDGSRTLNILRACFLLNRKRIGQIPMADDDIQALPHRVPLQIVSPSVAGRRVNARGRLRKDLAAG